MKTIEALVDRQLKRRAVEEAARSRTEPEEIVEPPLRVVTISRQAGSGGHVLAERLADRLGFELIDRQILEMLVDNTGACESLLKSLDERTRSGLNLWVEGIMRGRYVDRSEYIRWLVRSIGILAEHGDAVILGRAGNVILAPRGGLHIRLVAPEHVRVRNLATWQGWTPKEAQAYVSKTDEERRQFCRDNFGADNDDPLGYDLVINTGRVEQGAALELMVGAWERYLERESSG